jgi:hypothetical protein
MGVKFFAFLKVANINASMVNHKIALDRVYLLVSILNTGGFGSSAQ